MSLETHSEEQTFAAYVLGTQDFREAYSGKNDRTGNYIYVDCTSFLFEGHFTVFEDGGSELHFGSKFEVQSGLDLNATLDLIYFELERVLYEELKAGKDEILGSFSLVVIRKNSMYKTKDYLLTPVRAEEVLEAGDIIIIGNG